MQMEENNKMRAIVDMNKTKREMDGLRPKGHTGTVDHPSGCAGQNILEIKNLGH